MSPRRDMCRGDCGHAPVAVLFHALTTSSIPMPRSLIWRSMAGNVSPRKARLRCSMMVARAPGVTK